MQPGVGRCPGKSDRPLRLVGVAKRSAVGQDEAAVEESLHAFRRDAFLAGKFDHADQRFVAQRHEVAVGVERLAVGRENKYALLAVELKKLAGETRRRNFVQVFFLSSTGRRAA